MFKNWIQTIQRGNEYRKNKYGPEETFAESYARARRHVVWERENLRPKTKFYWPWTEESQRYFKSQDDFKKQFAFWDEWTGSRYERVENTKFKTVKDRFSVCRKNAVTGEWEKIMTKRYATFTTVSMFKHRYVVEMKDDDKLEHMADLVTCEELEEFSQSHIDEVIVDSSIITEEEMLNLFRKDNTYLANWSDEYVLGWVKRLEDKFK